MRLFLGAATLSLFAATACADAPAQLGQVPSFTKVDLDQWFLRDSHLIVTAPNGLIAISGAARSSDNPTGSPEESIGILGVVLNDREGGRGWAGYLEANHEAGATWTAGLEIAVKNRSENLTSTPYYAANGSFGIWLAGGGDASYGGAPANPSNAALYVRKNAAKFNAGLVLDQNAITGTDGVSGTGTAIHLAKGHVIRWGAPGNYQGANLYSDVATPNKSVNQVFVDDGVMWTDSSGNITAAFKKDAPPQFGSYAPGGEAVCGSIEIKDTSGTLRKLAVLC